MANVDSSILPYLEGIATAEEYAKALKAVNARGGNNPLPTERQQQIVKAVARARTRAAWKAKRASQKGRRTKEKPLPAFKGSYSKYLRSPQWARKRRAALERYGSKCRICGAAENLEVHHRNYNTIYNENLKDLEVLCRGCHENEHEGKHDFVADPMTREFMDRMKR